MWWLVMRSWVQSLPLSLLLRICLDSERICSDLSGFWVDSDQFCSDLSGSDQFWSDLLRSDGWRKSTDNRWDRNKWSYFRAFRALSFSRSRRLERFRRWLEIRDVDNIVVIVINTWNVKIMVRFAEWHTWCWFGHRWKQSIGTRDPIGLNSPFRNIENLLWQRRRESHCRCRCSDWRIIVFIFWHAVCDGFNLIVAAIIPSAFGHDGGSTDDH